MMFMRGWGRELSRAETQRRRDAEEGVMTENAITGDILDASIKLHRQFGAGLLESVYETLLEKVLAAHFPFKYPICGSQ